MGDRLRPLDSYVTKFCKMALIQIYTNMEMMLIRMTSAFNQMLLLHCFLMSFLGLLSDAYNHDVEFDLSEENLVDVAEETLMTRAKHMSGLLPLMTFLTAFYVIIARRNNSAVEDGRKSSLLAEND